MRIVLIVFKNTSTLDFIIPFLWFLKKNNNLKSLDVIYFTGNSRQILRNGKFFSEFITDLGGKEHSLMKLSPILRWFSFLFSHSASDTFNFEEVKFITNAKLLKKLGLMTKFVVLKLIKRFESILIKYLFPKTKLRELLQGSILLLDNRPNLEKFNEEKLYSILDEIRPRTILLPHAPHYIVSDLTFFPLSKKYGDFPSYCKSWVPFKETEIKEYENQVDYVGYPGFDLDWKNHFLVDRKTHHLRCLYVGRKFLDKDMVIPEGYNFVTLSFKEILKDLNEIARVFNSINIEIELVFKPHPSSNFNNVKAVLEESELDFWSITPEPFYSELKEIDFVITPYSTSALIPAIFGIPTIILSSKVQNIINDSWEQVEKIYRGLTYYIERDQLEITMLELKENNFSPIKKDEEHLRKLFPDGASMRGLNSLSSFLANKNPKMIP